MQMSRVAYVNGRYVNLRSPAVRVEDRGYQFADGVYEVAKVVNGRFCNLERHLDRLERSLALMQMPMPMTRRALAAVLRETWRRNAIPNATVYLQVSRGVAARNHAWKPDIQPSVVVTVRPAKFPTKKEIEEGVKVISLRDERWAHCEIKSVSLLPNVLAKQRATEAGAREAWLVDSDGYVTEGCSSNAYIVDPDGRLVTRPLGPQILGGVTRSIVLELARKAGIVIVERPFSLEEAKHAREAFLTSTTSLVLPVTQIDEQPIGNGRPGSIGMRLLEAYAALESVPLP
jgi:D-alanine transaminase